MKKKQAEYLFNTGFISEGKIFSPIFELYIHEKTQKEKGKQTKEFSKKEHMLLTFLKNNKNEICEREEIIENVWPEAETVGVSDWAIDRLVSRLRNKLKNQNSQIEIITVKTRGYKLIHQNK